MATKTGKACRPIIFSGPMVRAILAGKKTQTRRVIKTQPDGAVPPGFYFDAYNGGPEWCWWTADDRVANSLPPAKCRWAPGDLVWVKEGWSPDHAAFYPNFPVVYRADVPPIIEDGRVYSDEARAWFPFRWRSPLFMPRHLSRVTLRVTAIHAERLQEISIEDVLAEGIPEVTDGPHANEYWREETGAKFVRSWDRINGKRHPWDSDPLVWVVSFERVTP